MCIYINTEYWPEHSLKDGLNQGTDFDFQKRAMEASSFPLVAHLEI